MGRCATGGGDGILLPSHPVAPLPAAAALGHGRAGRAGGTGPAPRAHRAGGRATALAQPGPGFAGLLRAICGQQISNQAAAAIWRRLCAVPGALDPAGLLALDDATLCGVAGLSRPKAAHARSLAAACLDGRLDFTALAALPDAEAVRRMTLVKG
ncbi:hypothetical protein ACFQU2_17275 [Siccirubricoccus deserti]